MILVFMFLSFVMIAFYLFYFIYMSRASKKEKDIKKVEYNPLVSIIVPTYNEEVVIKNKLQNINEQNYKKYELEIIDSASTDQTVNKIKEFINENNIELNLIQEDERRGKAFALNKIFKNIKGEIVIITDADVIWESNVIENFVKIFSNKKIGAVTGKKILIHKKEASKNEGAYQDIFDIIRKGESNIDSTMIFNGPAMAFRSELLDPMPIDTIADDSHLAMMIRKKGFRTIFDENIIFYENLLSGKNFFNQKIRRGQGLVQAFLRNIFFLFNSNYGKFGMILFPAEFFMHIISPIMTLLLVVLFSIIMIYHNIYLYYSIGSVIILLVLSRTLKLNLYNVIIAFLEYQLILLLSLLSYLVGSKQYIWQVLEREGIDLKRGGQN